MTALRFFLILDAVNRASVRSRSLSFLTASASTTSVESLLLLLVLVLGSGGGCGDGCCTFVSTETVDSSLKLATVSSASSSTEEKAFQIL